MRKSIAIAAAGAGGVLVLGGAGVAIAGNGDDGPLSHQLSNSQEQAASEAALEATGGGEVNSVETDDENGATYEVEVTKTDGSTVDVRLDEQYAVVVIESDQDSSADE